MDNVSDRLDSMQLGSVGFGVILLHTCAAKLRMCMSTRSLRKDEMKTDTLAKRWCYESFTLNGRQ